MLADPFDALLNPEHAIERVQAVQATRDAKQAHHLAERPKRGQGRNSVWGKYLDVPVGTSVSFDFDVYGLLVAAAAYRKKIGRGVYKIRQVKATGKHTITRIA